MIATLAVANTKIAPTISETKGKDTSWLKTSFYQNSKPSIKELKDYLASEVAKYPELSYSEIEAIIYCESSFQVDPPHNNICRGIAQFKIGTFNWFTGMMNEKLEFMDPYDQIKVMVWAFANGYKNHWECYTKN